MGRAFEYRKARKMKRWDAMAKAFTRIGREIAIAVREGGGDPDTNPRLRVAIQNAKGVNMPKTSVDAAIKRATSKEEKAFEELVYQGYGPHGVAIVVECATDNPTRTVANVRLYFNRAGGALGKTGSLDFMFDRKGVFHLPSEGQDMEELEMKLIDMGAEDIQIEEDGVYVYTTFADFAPFQKALEEAGIPVQSSELQRIPNSFAENLTPEQEEDIIKLLDRFEEDDDVQNVFHNMNLKE